MSTSGDALPYKLINDIPIPLLRTRDDWPMWKEYIEKTAKICGAWEYCDPAINEDEYLEQKATLFEPTFNTVRPDACSITDLDDVDFKKLRSLVKEYKAKKLEFDQRKMAIVAIEELIHASVSGKYTKCIAFVTPYYQLKALSKVFSSPSADDINEISSEWLALQQLGEKPDVQEYITCWKELFKKCLDLKLVDGSQDEALGKSLMDSQDPAKMWKPLQFQSWFVKPGLSEFDTEDTDTWGPVAELNSEADDKSQNEDEDYDGSWTSEAVEHSDDEGEDAFQLWGNDV